MEYLGFIYGIFGVAAFISVISLGTRVSRLERRMRVREDRGNDLRTHLQKRIGERVRFSFYDDEEDIDIELYYTQSGYLEIMDVDETWVYIHGENGKRQMDKLLRISSIKGVETIADGE
ncbi:MAG: hypothetical protein Q4D32_03945 [Eubacteriales bacterium]|nr:hypothetical protein [Eubacteriales bacterium]